jgi:hypothetical protein
LVKLTAHKSDAAWNSERREARAASPDAGTRGLRVAKSEKQIFGNSCAWDRSGPSLNQSAISVALDNDAQANSKIDRVSIVNEKSPSETLRMFSSLRRERFNPFL